MNSFLSNFPLTRPRRLRKAEWIRKLVQENKVSLDDLILPIFLTYDTKSSLVNEMPNIYRYSVNDAVYIANKAYEVGIKAIALFPEVPHEKKDALGTEALNEENIICRTVREIKRNVNGIGVICDVALDPYTLSGHDGILSDNNIIDNDKTVDVLCKQALINASAGCDIIAPSDMMDGRVIKIREKLDNAKYIDTLIMSYAAKYASSFYDPFRKAISAESNLGTYKKKSYQMDYSNSNEALKEVALDIKEGTDIILIKPGLPFLDILNNVKTTFKIPTFSFQVSGEYAMIIMGINNGIFNKQEIIMETLSCFKRAGADAILTYFALDAAEIIKNG